MGPARQPKQCVKEYCVRQPARPRERRKDGHPRDGKGQPTNKNGIRLLPDKEGFEPKDAEPVSSYARVCQWPGCKQHAGKDVEYCGTHLCKSEGCTNKRQSDAKYCPPCRSKEIRKAAEAFRQRREGAVGG